MDAGKIAAVAVMRSMQVALCSLVMLGCVSTPASREPVAVVRSSLAARTLEEALSMLAPEYRLWFGTRSGEGKDKARAAAMLEWDFALRPQHRIGSSRSARSPSPGCAAPGS